MFMGGADSIDKSMRYIGVDWFPDEVVKESDLDNLPDVNVDIFVTHTCPEELLSEMLTHNRLKAHDPSQQALSELWKRYKPDLWFFGHWHVYEELDMFGTKCYTLGMSGRYCPSDKWWMWLEHQRAH
jgi:hypothetical protein